MSTPEADPASGEVRLQRSVVVLAGQNPGRLAILGDVHHLVQGALEAARARGIDRHRNQSRAHTAKKRADHLQPRRVGQQKPVLGRETALLPQVAGDRLRPTDKLRVGVAFDWIAVQVKKRIQELVRMLNSQLVQLV